MSNNKDLPPQQTDPFAPFARKAFKHEWNESILSAIEDQLAASVAAMQSGTGNSSGGQNNNNNNNANNNKQNNNNLASSSGGNKPGTANSNQGKREGGGSNKKDGNPSGDFSMSEQMQSYVPIKRHVVNGSLVSLFSDKRILLMGGSAGGESLTQVAEFDVATKQWSHGLHMPARRSEGTAVVCFVAPPPQPKPDDDGINNDPLLPSLAENTGGTAATGANRNSNANNNNSNNINNKSMVGKVSGLGGGAGASSTAAAGKRGGGAGGAANDDDRNAISSDPAAALVATTPQHLVVLFGGWNDQQLLGDTLFWLVSGVCPATPEHKVSGKWWRLSPSALAPSPRRGHSMVSLVDSASVVQRSLPSAAAVSAGALQPGTTTAHASYSQIRYNTSVFVFGGFDGATRLNDLWELAVPFNCSSPASVVPPANPNNAVAADGLAWRRVQATGFQPTPRDGAALAADAVNRRLFLFGGFSTHRENDCYSFDIETSLWTKLSLAPSPPCRFGSFAAISSNFALVGLGQDSKGPSNAMFQLLIPPTSSSSSSSSPLTSNQNNNNNNISSISAGKDTEQQQQQDASTLAPQQKWSLCPLENGMLVEATKTTKKMDKDDPNNPANANTEVDPEARIDFAFCATPELGPVLLHLNHLTTEGGNNNNNNANNNNANRATKDSGRGGQQQQQQQNVDSSRGGPGTVDALLSSQKRTLWIFGGANDKSQYNTSLLEIEMDRQEVIQTKTGRK
jgi:hypothetical protein